MNVPEEVLEELRCSKCEVYLSRGPIYLQHDGAAACGRCFTSKNPATRNTQYEALARLARFPCKNRDLGCPTTVPFAEDAQDIAHEEVCEFRQYVCPVLGSARCDWLGSRAEMLQHCQAQHPARVLDNPCSLVHDISTSSLHNYLLTAFHLLFLLHTKVCVTSGKIFHAVRFLGASANASEFNYTLQIERKNEHFLKKGQVVGQGCLAIQEDTSMALNTNSLLDMLGGGDGITFTLTLMRQESSLKTCTECDALVTVLEYSDEDGWYCEKCIPIKRCCIFDGCSFMDFDYKCYKHESNFCEHSLECIICDLSIPQNTLSTHYESAHSDVTYKTGSKFQITLHEYRRQLILQSIVGTVICWYQLELENAEFLFEVHSSLPNRRLHEFKCTVRVIQPSTGRDMTFSPDASYNTDYDWRIDVTKEHFSIWSNQFDTIVDISKSNL